ncbi:MAG: hypothetical protein JWM81_660 [Candidatus Saccharibacteria bacterium]|nr:hypothetical protein [Candidatus Saccharibacteria bacterium]
MSNALISLFLAAGGAAFTYAKMGPRLGYGNSQNVWMLVGIVFALIFVVFMVLLNTLIKLN